MPPPEADEAPAPIPIRPIPGDLSTRLATWENAARTTPFSRDEPDAIVPLVRDLREWRAFLGRERWGQAAAILGERLGWDYERMEALVRLTEAHEIRWALRAETHTPNFVPSEAETGLYPTTGWLADYLAWSTRQTEVPTAFQFWTGVVVLASALRRNVYVDGNNFQVWPNQYVILVGDPSVKKGQAMAMGSSILKRVNQYLTQRNAPEAQHFNLLPKKATLEYVVKAMAGKASQAVLENGASEFDLMTDSHGVWFCPELVTLLSTSAYNADAIIQFLVDVFECPPDDSGFGTIARGLENLRNISVNFMGATAEGWVRNHITPALLEGGFISRTTFIYRQPTRTYYHRPAIADPVVRDRLADGLVPLLDWRAKVIRETRAADEWEREWYQRDRTAGETVTDERFKYYHNRRQIHVLKMASLLAVSAGRDVIDVPDLEMAVRIMEHEEGQVTSLFENIGSHVDTQHSNFVLSVIEKNGGRIDKSALIQKTKHKVGAVFNLDRLLETLTQERRIQTLRSPRGADIVCLIRQS